MDDDKSILDEDRELSFVEKLKRAVIKRGFFSTVFGVVDLLFVFIAANTFGRLAYDWHYLRGKWFRRPWSPGWRWVWNGTLAKIFLGKSRGIPWPVSSQSVTGRNVDFHIDDLNNFQGTAYFQTFGDARIRIGRGTWIARGCAIITSNHNPQQPDVHLAPQDVIIGDHSWLGANVVVMPGVELGPHSVVGANAVVTKSFPEGHCILAGVPARIIRSNL